MKREGDGATPRGCFPLRKAYFRADHIGRPAGSLAIERLTLRSGWCDAASDRNYNRFVRHPYPASAEEMWRPDGLYDLVIVVGYNDRPRVRGRGSAIFVHVARPGFRPTEGCVALKREHLARLMPYLGKGTRLIIK